MHALRKVIPQIKLDEDIPNEVLDQLKVSNEDFAEARKHVEPSAMREVLVEVPDVTWNQVGGLEDVKQELREAVEWPHEIPGCVRAAPDKTAQRDPALRSSRNRKNPARKSGGQRE